MKIETPQIREQVGRNYKLTRFAVHSRKVGSEGWYGCSHYKTEAEAIDAMNKTGDRFADVGGITVDLGEATELYEYRIVRIESNCTILSACIRKV